ncbi:MAG: AAA family ATPase [bacterium]|nr:AAA family ATPase [bacterium]
MLPSPIKNQVFASFFGGVRLTWQGKKITDFATQKVLGLFCYLLDNRNLAVPRDRLITMFWGESPENQARYNLRYALWNIRKLFKELDDRLEPILANRTDCQIDPDFPIVTDVELFLQDLSTPIGTERLNALIRAVERYRGKFLDGFTLRNLDDWEEWLFHRREELQRKVLDCMIEIGNTYSQMKQYSKAIEYFMRALSIQSDLDAAHEGIIRAYASQGKNTAALRQYATYVEIMRREYHAPPKQSIFQLAEAIRLGDDSKVRELEPPNLTGVSFESTTSISTKNIQTEEPKEEPLSSYEELLTIKPSFKEELPVSRKEDESLVSFTSPSSHDVFIGRKEELFTLQQAAEIVIHEKLGHVVIISGEMGIGKTRLFQRFLEEIPETMIVGLGENDEIPNSQPLNSVFQILQSFLKNRHLSNKQRSELESLLQTDPLSITKPTEENHFISEVKKWILSVSTTNPVLIAMDDLHWATEIVFNFFASLAQETKRYPILLIGIFRTFEETTEDVIASSLISTARTGRLIKIDLKSLSDDETIALINSRATRVTEQLNRKDLVKISRYSCGIPLFAVELANFLLEENLDFIHSPLLEDRPDFSITSLDKLIPPLLLKITNLRLSKLSDQSSELLKSISLLIGEFSIEFVSLLSGLDVDTIEDIFVDLESRNFIHHIERGNDLLFAFNHQLIKIAIADTISSLERRRLFKNIVAAIEQWDGEINIEALSYYYYHAGDQINAARYLMESAKQWYAYGDKSRCMQFSSLAYKAAIENLTQHPEELISIILSHCDLLVKLDKVKDAISVYNLIIEKIEAHKPLSPEIGLDTKREELKRLLKNRTIKKQIEFSPILLISTKRSLANVKLLQNDLVGAKTLLQQVEKSLDNLPDSPATIRETGLFLQVKAKVSIQEGKTTEAIKLLDNSIDLLSKEGLSSELIESWLLLADVYIENQQSVKAKSTLEKCKTYCHQESDELNEAQCYYRLGSIAFREGNLANAEQHLSRAIELIELQSSLVPNLGDFYLEYAQVLWANNKKKQAKEFLEKAENEFQESHNDLGLEKIQHLRKNKLLPT